LEDSYPVVGDVVLVDRSFVVLAAELDDEDPAAQLSFDVDVSQRDDRVRDAL
jgi:hypothetical protein